MTGFDVQSAISVGKRFHSIAVRARLNEMSRDDVLEILEANANEFYLMAEKIDDEMKEEVNVR